MKKEKSYKKSLSFRFSLLVTGTLFLVGLLWSGITSNQEEENKNSLQQSPVIGSISQDHIQQVGQNLAAKDKPGSVTHLSVGKIDAEKFKTKDGKEGWRVSIPGGRALATPAVYKDVVYVGGGFGSYEFYAFDSSNGHPRWAIKVSDDGPTAAVAAEDKVVFNTESCTLFVVDAKTRKKEHGVSGRPLILTRRFRPGLHTMPPKKKTMLLWDFPVPRKVLRSMKLHPMSGRPQCVDCGNIRVHGLVSLKTGFFSPRAINWWPLILSPVKRYG